MKEVFWSLRKAKVLKKMFVIFCICASNPCQNGGECLQDISSFEFRCINDQKYQVKPLYKIWLVVVLKFLLFAQKVLPENIVR